MVVRESLHCRFCEAGTPIWRPIVGICLQTNVGAERPIRLQASLYGFPASLKKEKTCRGGGTKEASDPRVQTVGDMAPPRTFKRR